MRRVSKQALMDFLFVLDAEPWITTVGMGEWVNRLNKSAKVSKKVDKSSYQFSVIQIYLRQAPSRTHVPAILKWRNSSGLSTCSNTSSLGGPAAGETLSGRYDTIPVIVNIVGLDTF